MVNTTGAGNAFAAGLVVALSRGTRWEGALEIGSVVAAISVQPDAARPAYPTLGPAPPLPRRAGRAGPL